MSEELYDLKIEAFKKIKKQREKDKKGKKIDVMRIKI